jgi:ABC-type Fe3+-hydroxamate transport system substrate-binding protein
MNTFVKITAAGLAAVALTACVENERVVRTEPVAQASSTHSPENLAERTCTAALARELQVPASDLRIISTQFTNGELWVKVRVPTAEQPWACILDRNAKLIRTQYMGQG